MKMPITPKVFGPENVILFFRKGRTTALKGRRSRMHQMKIKDFTDQNVILVKN